MTTPPDGGPAFPRFTSSSTMDGMSLRCYIATAALQGMELKHDGKYNNADRSSGFPELEAKWNAIAAVRYADALIAELTK